MCSHLVRRGAVYHTRLVVPVRLRSIIGKSDLGRSLRTKDLAEAKRLLGPWLTQARATIEAAEAELARRQVVTMPFSAKAIACQRRAEAQEREQLEADEEWQAERDRLDNERNARIEAQDEYAKLLRIRITGSTADMAPEDAVIARLLREHQADAAFWKQIASDREFALEQLRAAGVATDSQDDDMAPPLPTLPKFPIASQRASEGKSEAVTITRLFEEYAKQPNGPTPTTVRQWRGYIKHLVAYLGHDKAVRVTSHDLIKWREALRTEKSGRGKPLSSKTINGSYLAAANVTFGYGLDQLLLPANPMASVKPVRADKKPKLRARDFTTAEWQAILKAALTPAGGKLSAKRELARRWVPWLCAYSGARVNEITQLRAEDVSEIDGVWTMLITPEAGGVKTNEARTVPLHMHLLEQGFLEVVKGKDGPLFYDPSRARGGQENRHHKKVGMFLSEWVRKKVGVADINVAPNHGWRHTFKTICREVEIDEEAADYIQGHAHKGQGRRYGSNTIPALAKQLAKFPRFEID